MDNVKDYILWMQDFTFSQTGFRDVDAMVLSNLCYYDMSELFRGQTGPVRVRDCQKLIDAADVKVEMVIGGDKYKELLQAAVNSRRFGDLVLTDYVDYKSVEPPVQFAAVTFREEGGLSFIAFRGTDDTLAGWYEDCIASFSKTEAQEMAREYAARVIGADSRGRWMMGGHSKGGNLALYVGCTINEELLDCVEKIYDLDGPGLSVDVMGEPVKKAVLDKTTRILPEFSVVGRIFDMDIPDTKIVKSFELGMLQHAPISWGVEHGSIAAAPANNPISVRFNEFFSRWVAAIDIGERRIFFDEIYEALSSGGSTTLAELVGEGFEGFKRIQSRLKNCSEVTKRVMYEFMRQAFLGPFLQMHKGTKEDE